MGLQIRIGKQSLEKARTAKLLGGKPRPFGIYPATIEDALPIGNDGLSIDGKHYAVRVLTGPTSQLNGELRGRLYQELILI